MSGVTIVSRKLRLRYVRTELGLTQYQLYQLSGVSEPTISRAEAGKPLRALSAQRLLKALNAQRKAQGMGELDIDDLDWVIDGD
jgi:transcriptional regulator with XRE-family HTH domain